MVGLGRPEVLALGPTKGVFAFFINSRVAKVLTLGAGGDDQSHVSRPRTAKTTQNSNFKRPDSKLETITERNPAEEEAIAVS